MWRATAEARLHKRVGVTPLGFVRTRAQAVGFAAQIAWLTVALVLLNVTWARGIRKYSAVGA